ncbi:SPOR domain-containing protein [Sphingomicrobium clamense]|uniref:SPOR domain-containing protein n=1 Tax=Sphingomicrobium clamense TaxID=2851013 RepID=A0ABS6V6S1_9SPHN|nr:SPOR domain-containing protein [Sphingomicrobium sp. B8]MBW0145266.1 SPOR domain-containing protein [Sphingomicrobium sp. B8]
MSRNISIATAALALVLAAPLAAQDSEVKAGIDAWTRGDFASAVETWAPLAENGNADARFNLGQAYRLGRGVDRDLARAQSLFRSAAAAGHLEAQAVLGLMLFNDGNREEALGYLKQAAERGEPRALLVYGTALYNGDDIARDPVRAYAFVSRAAAQGLAPAKTTLAEMDKILPVEVRQQGVQLAQTLVAQSRARQQERTAERTPVPAPRPAPAPTPTPAPKREAPAKAETKPAPKPTPPPAAKPTPVPTPAPAATSASGWRVQLGAFSKASSADALYDQVKGLGALSGTRKMTQKAGAVTRLQVGPFANRAAANRACEAIKSSGNACFVVAP